MRKQERKKQAHDIDIAFFTSKTSFTASFSLNNKLFYQPTGFQNRFSRPRKELD